MHSLLVTITLPMTCFISEWFIQLRVLREDMPNWNLNHTVCKQNGWYMCLMTYYWGCNQGVLLGVTSQSRILDIRNLQYSFLSISLPKFVSSLFSHIRNHNWFRSLQNLVRAPLVKGCTETRIKGLERFRFWIMI